MKIMTAKQYQAYVNANMTQGKPDMTAFDNACTQFRNVCNSIKEYFQLDEFKGGFDQMAVIAQHQKYLTTEGLGLAQAWSAANQLCKYEGSKVGYGQPQWWYYCWGMDVPNESTESEQ